MIYNIMRKDTVLARINMDDGFVQVKEDLPFGLNLSDISSKSIITDRVKNISNFKSWCAGRLLNLCYVNKSDNNTMSSFFYELNDDEKMKISLLYKCTDVQDDFWIKEDNDNSYYQDILSDRLKFYNRIVSISSKPEICAFRNFISTGF